jgi:uncharacterized lipoprotein YmbA
LAAAGATLFLAACAGTAAKTLYVLTPATPITAGVTSDIGVPVIAVMPVRIPDYLDTTDMLRDSGAQQVIVSTTGRWGERLSVGITDAVAAELAHRLPGTRFPTTQTAQPTRALLVVITSLRVTAAGACALQARWQLLGGDATTILASAQGGFTENGPANGDAALAATLSAAVTQLTDAIARSLPPGGIGRS